MVKCDVGTHIFSRYVTFDPSTLTVKVVPILRMLLGQKERVRKKPQKKEEYRC